jgi:metal-responsive CopG/Arc/MetJ family transcriptional regulator
MLMPFEVVRKRRGRPATGKDPVTSIRLSPELRAEIDMWCDQQPDRPRRSEAIRRLVEESLKAKRS